MGLDPDRHLLRPARQDLSRMLDLPNCRCKEVKRLQRVHCALSSATFKPLQFCIV